MSKRLRFHDHAIAIGLKIDPEPNDGPKLAFAMHRDGSSFYRFCFQLEEDNTIRLTYFLAGARMHTMKMPFSSFILLSKENVETMQIYYEESINKIEELERQAKEARVEAQRFTKQFFG